MRPVRTHLAILALLLVAAPFASAQEPPPPPPAPVPAPPPPGPPAKPKLEISGYVQLQYNATVDANGDDTVAKNTFLVRRFRIKLRGEVFKDVGYVTMFDPSTTSTLLRDAYVTLGFLPHHEVRIGQQKTQFGYDNPESSTKLFTINRAFISDALGRGSDLRDIGLGLFGNWKLPAGVGVDYELTLVNGSGPNLVHDDTARKNFWGRAGVSWAGDAATSVRLGGSYANGNQLRKAPAGDPTAM